MTDDAGRPPSEPLAVVHRLAEAQPAVDTRDGDVRANVAQPLEAKGKTNPQIAEVLWVSPATVRKHLENVYEKLGVNTRTAAVTRFLGLAEGQAPDAASIR